MTGMLTRSKSVRLASGYITLPASMRLLILILILVSTSIAHDYVELKDEYGIEGEIYG